MIVSLSGDNINSFVFDIAEIHYGAYSSRHFTSNFSRKKLREYYRCLIGASDVSFVYLINGKVAGFVVAGRSVDKGVTLFVKKNKLYLLSVFLMRPAFIIEKIQAIFLSKINSELNNNLTDFRLMSISVCSKLQSQGVGERIINELEFVLRNMNINEYGLSVRNNNIRAINFYLRNDFVVESESRSAVYLRKELA